LVVYLVIIYARTYVRRCGHCNAMADDWVTIGAEFGEDESVVIGEVDCTDTAVGNDNFCSEFGVEGFPSLKFGASFDLKEYEGGRDYESLAAFANENMGPQCGPQAMDNCTDEEKIQLVTYMNMPEGELDSLIDSNTKLMIDVQETFHTGVQALEEEYSQAQGGLPGNEENIMQMILQERDTVEQMLALSDEELAATLEDIQSQKLPEEDLEALVESLQDRYEVMETANAASRHEILAVGGLTLMHSVAEYKSKNDEKKEL